MRHPRPGLLHELIPVSLVLLALAGTTGLVVAMHQHASSSRRAPKTSQITVALPKPPAPDLPPPPKPIPPPPVVVQPPPPPPEDPTPKALARVASQAEEQRTALAEADRKAQALEAARKLAVAESEKWRRKELLVKAQVEKIASQADRLESEADALAAERDVLARERDAAKAALVKARAKDGGYAVLPHRGANGTWQRPVMIECTDGVAILQPSNQRFTMVDMSPLTSPRGSPLISAVARELIKAHRANTPDGDSVVPYIYFVVRPDGIRPFYEARGRLEPLGISFGYELVEQDWQIEFPNLDDPAVWEGGPPSQPRDPNGPLASASPTLGGNGGNARGNGSGSGSGSGAADFVWPADRPNASRADTPAVSGNRDDPDAFTWPRTPPGGATRGLSGPDVGPNGKPPGVANIDADGIIRGGLGAIRGDVDSSESASQNRANPRRPGTRSGFSRPTIGGPAPDPRTIPGQPGEGGSKGKGKGKGDDSSPALVALGPDGLPGLDPPPSGNNPVTAPGSGAGGSPSPTNPAPGATDATLIPFPTTPGASGSPRGSSAPKTGAPRSGRLANLPPGVAEALNPPPVAPRGDGRVRIDPAMLARANEDDPFGDPPSLPDAQPPGASGGSGPRGNRPASSSAGSPPSGAGTASPSSGGTTSPSGIGLPSLALDGPRNQDKHPTPSTSPVGKSDRKKVIDVPLELVVSCGPDGVVVHPGGYSLTSATLRKSGILKRDLQTIVRNHELIDPMVRPKPRLQFLVEPGGSDSYWEARRQTVLDGLSWPVSIEVVGPQSARVFPKERF